MAQSLVKLTLESNQYEKGLRNAQKQLDDFTKGIGISAKAFSGMAVSVAAVTGALKVAKDAFFANETQLDDWNRAIQSAEGVYKGFLNALNTGDISGFLTNIDTITEAAKAAYDALDNLSTFNAFNRVNLQRTRTGMTEAIAGFRLGETSKEDVKKAAEAYKKELIERQRLEQEAYSQKIREVAAQRGVPWGNLEQALSGDYGTYQQLKQVQPTGEKMVSYGAGMFGSGSYIQKFAVTAEEKMGEALRALNDTELDALQSLGEQAQRTGEEIAQIDKQLSRVLNKKEKSTPKTGGGSGRTKTTTAPTYAEDSIAAQSALVSDLRKKWSEAGEAVRNDLLVQLIAAEDKLKAMNNQAALFRENQQGKLLGGDIQTSGLGNISLSDQINEAAKGLQGDALEALQKLIKGGNDAQKSWTSAASAIGSVGSALAGIDDPAAKVMGTIAQAIATIALTYAKSLEKTFTPWDWIAAAASGVATMVSVISTIHSATGYAEGGVIKGNSFSGDSLLAQGPDGGMIGLNAGEVVLNRAQAGVLASAIQDSGGGNGRIVGVLRGEDIALVADRWGRRTGKGELAFFK